jgi:hypothetical protein
MKRRKSKKTKTAIILGYGLFSIENKGYKSYLDFFVEELEDEKYNKCILCGGFTNPKRQMTSEAGSMLDYLVNIKRFPKGMFVLEEKSITTIENIRFAADLIRDVQVKRTDITIYCDMIRKIKAFWIAAHYMLEEDKVDICEALYNYKQSKEFCEDLKHKNLCIRSFDFKRNEEDTVKQQIGTSHEIIALYDQDVYNAIIEQRKKDLGL